MGWFSPVRALGARARAEAAATSATTATGRRHLPAAATARASDGNRARRPGRLSLGGWGGACSEEGRGPRRGAGPGLRRKRVLGREGAGSADGRGGQRQVPVQLEAGWGLGRGAESGTRYGRGSEEGRKTGGTGTRGGGHGLRRDVARVRGGTCLGETGQRKPVRVGAWPGGARSEARVGRSKE